MPKPNIVARVRELLSPTVAELGYLLWDVEYEKVGADWYLRITIDSAQGITIEDCERVHRAIDPLLDEADPIENSYRLEVSSPGIERELRTEEHILAFLGTRVEVRLYRAYEGQKVLKGTLLSFAEGNVTLQTKQATVTLARADIAKMHVVYFD